MALEAKHRQMTPQHHLSIASLASQPGSIRGLFLICVLLVVGSILSAGWHVAFKAEFGALELASFLCLSIAAIVSFSFYREGIIRLWPVPFVFALLALREMDFQDWWFEPGLLRAEIFTLPVPVFHKVISAIAMVAIAGVLFNLFARGVRPFMSAVWARDTWAIVILFSCVAVTAALLFDGSEKNFAAIGITLSPFVSKVVSYGEEIVEFAFAFLLVVSVILFARKHR